MHAGHGFSKVEPACYSTLVTMSAHTEIADSCVKIPYNRSLFQEAPLHLQALNCTVLQVTSFKRTAEQKRCYTDNKLRL